jgi:deoxyhypusine synthase
VALNFAFFVKTRSILYGMREVSHFLERNFKHFNARESLDSAKAYKELIDNSGKIVLSLAGAMSTAELGISLARMIREDKIHAISSTAANLEEDIFNLVGNKNYKLIPNYHCLTPQQEEEIRDSGFNRVTDTCIPEDIMLSVEGEMLKLWKNATEKKQSFFPYEYFYMLIKSGYLDDKCHVPKGHSWVMAACEKNIPIFTPGWEDSTLGNLFTAKVMKGALKDHSSIRRGTEQFESLLNWYMKNEKDHPIGFFQIGGGTAGDFAICAVPCILQDLKLKCNYWAYYSQITDSTTSYGSFSGCTPNEKITWHKLSKDTPRFFINSDATIVAPLIFSYVLGD